jgi:hypothetical protein
MSRTLNVDARRPAWERLGRTYNAPISGEAALEEIGNYSFEKRRYKEFLNNKWVESEDWRIYRSPLPDDKTERPIGNATDRYTIIQPMEVVKLFDEKVGKSIDTIGFLTKDGRRMFLTWAMPKIQVVRDDVVDLVGFLTIGFDTFMGMSLSTIGNRLLCRNAFRRAQSEAQKMRDGKGRGLVWTGKHTDKNIKEDLGIWMNYVEEKAEQEAGLLESFFKKLAEKPIKNDKEVHRILNYAYPDPDPIPVDAFIPPSKRQAREEKVEDEKQLMTQYRDEIAELFFGTGTAISRDYWGLFNSGTEYFNHIQMEKKDAAASILVGQRNKRMNQLAEVLDYESRKK